nr:hypothetical protein [Tanacetum cinerariifolium]
GNPPQYLQDKRVIDSDCSRHMSYLIDYEEIDGGYVAFGASKDETSAILKTFITGIENLVDHKAEAVNTACYVQNRVLVVKPYNKTPYKLFHGRTPALRFMRPFGYLVTILNTKDYLGKFDGSKPNWLFDIDALTKSMNYKLVIKGNQSNGNAGTKACDDAGKDRMETVNKDPRQESKCKDKENEDNVNNTNNVNVASINRVNVVGANTNNELAFDLEMPELEDISTFNFSNEDEDDGAEADINNLDTPTIRIHKDHLLDQVIGDLHSTTQTRNMYKNLEEHGFVTTIHQTKNHKDLQNCLFACFLSQEELKKTLMDLPYGKKAIGTKWVFKNKKDERGIMIRNKAWLVAQGHTQEERIDYDEVFTPVARIKAIRLFLAYASFKDFVVYQMDVKSAFLYGKIEEEVYVYQPPGFEDPEFPDKEYNVEKALYRLHQAPRSWKSRRHDTEVPQLSVPTSVVDKAINEEMYDSLERAATTATSLDAEQDRGNIIKTQSKETPNEPVSQETSSGGGPRCQEAIGDAAAQTKSERAFKISNDSLLVEVNTSQSGEDILKLTELMELYINLQNRVLNLETTKITQAMEISSLKRRVKNLERERDKGLGEEDASKQGRITDINANKDIYLVNVHTDKDIFGVNDDDVIVEDAEMLFDVADDLRGEEVFILQEVPLNATAATTTTTIIDDITLDQALVELKSEKPKATIITVATTITATSSRPKAKGIVIHDQERAPAPTVSSQQPS